MGFSEQRHPKQRSLIRPIKRKYPALSRALFEFGGPERNQPGPRMSESISYRFQNQALR